MAMITMILGGVLGFVAGLSGWLGFGLSAGAAFGLYLGISVGLPLLVIGISLLRASDAPGRAELRAQG